MLKIKKNEATWVSRDTVPYFSTNPEIWKTLKFGGVSEVSKEDFEKIKKYVIVIEEIKVASKPKVEFKRKPTSVIEVEKVNEPIINEENNPNREI